MLSEKMADWRIIMKKEETKIVDLYDLSHTQAADFLRQFTYPWEALAHSERHSRRMSTRGAGRPYGSIRPQG